jgi:hypothetical protein
VPHLAALGPVTVAELVLRYVAIGDEIAQHEVTIPVIANIVSAEEAATAVPDAEVRAEVMILLSAKARDEAVFDASAGNFEEARARISALKQELRASGSPRLAEEADALEVAESYLEPNVYAASGRKNLHYDSWNRRRRNLS